MSLDGKQNTTEDRVADMNTTTVVSPTRSVSFTLITTGNVDHLYKVGIEKLFLSPTGPTNQFGVSTETNSQNIDRLPEIEPPGGHNPALHYPHRAPLVLTLQGSPFIKISDLHRIVGPRAHDLASRESCPARRNASFRNTNRVLAHGRPSLHCVHLLESHGESRLLWKLAESELDVAGVVREERVGEEGA